VSDTPAAAPINTDITPLCIDAVELARLLDVSPRQIYRLNDAGRLPAPLAFGACRRWTLREIEAWLAAGAPRRKDWEAMREPLNTPCAPLR
jgi:predicted DNA-binding transcriptional regulator AlpA